MLSDLEKFEFRRYSQNGEDGVLDRIFQAIGPTNKYFVEFGTGPNGSERNSRLLEENGWHGLLMDRSAIQLDASIRQEFVTAENINDLFAKYEVPEEFDLLSIDVDGNDYWIWNALSEKYRPRVVVIEYNAALGPNESRAIAYEPDFQWQTTDYFGASLTALVRLGMRKGYRLVHCESTGVNAFFVRRELCRWEVPDAATLFRPMAQWPHGGTFPRDSRDMVEVEAASITGVILARNEERNIVHCLEALRPHVGELILIDMESTDQTVALARPFVDKFLQHPLIPNFDAARNLAIPHAIYDWLWFVDADEFVPEQVGGQVLELVRSCQDRYEAIEYPFATYLSGQWMKHCGWWGYNGSPRVLKRGHFRFSEILHRGVELQGRAMRLPYESAVPHHSFRDLAHWIEKFNRYTSTEALQLAQRGVQWDWRLAAKGLAHDLWEHYERHNAKLDGSLGWIITWACSQYRWFSIAKLVDHVPNSPPSAPSSLDEALQAVTDELALLRAASPKPPFGVVLKTPIWDCSGYADEGRAFAKALATGTPALSLEIVNWNANRCTLPPHDTALLSALGRARRAPYVITITNCIPTLVAPDPAASVNVLRTTFETDRIPDEWLPIVKQFDEIWVTSKHTKDAFCRSWVPPEKLRIVGSCIDTDLFKPNGELLHLLPPQCGDNFIFLSVFDWQLRKGWDVLLRAYVAEFPKASGTVLLLKITRFHGQSLGQIIEQAEHVLAACNTTLYDRPDVIFWDTQLSTEQMAALYRSVDCFVLPSRGEGWGRPYAEAMASGIPVIGTGSSGNRDFMNSDNSFLLDSNLVNVPAEAAHEMPIYAGHSWHEPLPDDLQRQMRDVFDNETTRTRVARRGCADISTHCSIDAGRATLASAIKDIAAKFEPLQLVAPADSQIQLTLEGEFFAGHSFANVNEQLALGFSRNRNVALSINRLYGAPTFDKEAEHSNILQGYFDRPLTNGPKAVLRHCFPPNWEPPADGSLWIHIQPWEMDFLPCDWIEPLRAQVDEIWVPSNYVRAIYERSGINPDKIQVIPWGIDPDVFNPDAVPLLIANRRLFAFLFVGGTIERKGIDILLEAYCQEFSSTEDVCLIIKDQGSKTFYQGANFADQIEQARRSGIAPPIVYIDNNLTARQMSCLYAACQCLVAPYRGEGFCLPVLEAMACGLPVIVPSGGATDDFVRDSMGFRLPTRKAYNQHAGPLSGPPAWNEIDVDKLRRAMRHAFVDQQGTGLKGRAGSEHVRRKYTWNHTLDQMIVQLRSLFQRRQMHEFAVPTCSIVSSTAELPNAKSKSARIAACVELHNGEAYLPGLLAHLSPHVDELVVGDRRSSDRSRLVASEYGAKVIDIDGEAAHEWLRKAAHHIEADWIFLLLNGETISEETVRELRSVVDGAASQQDAAVFKLQRKQTFLTNSERSFVELRSFPNKSDIIDSIIHAEFSPDIPNGGRLSIAQSEHRIEPSPEDYTQGPINLNEWWLAPWIPTSGNTFVDIGANVGDWSEALAPRFNRVFAIEPCVEAARILQSRVPDNVIVCNFGAWSVNAPIEFSLFDNTLHTSAYFHEEGINTGPSRGKVVLPCASLDSLQISGPVDFVKCDTEGAEVECLKGFESTVQRDKPWLLVEIHSHSNFMAVVQLLISWDYRFSVVRDPHYPKFSDLWYRHCWLACQPAKARSDIIEPAIKT